MQKKDSEWRITDEDNERTYIVKKENGKLNIYDTLSDGKEDYRVQVTLTFREKNK